MTHSREPIAKEWLSELESQFIAQFGPDRSGPDAAAQRNVEKTIGDRVKQSRFEGKSA